jgi:signal transduction histidine kinase
VERARLFEPFSEGRAVAGERRAGLGLAIARRIATAHGGETWVESEPGQGAIFFAALPLGEKVERE